MVLPHGTGDLYHKYRPLKFSEIAGHKNVVDSIKAAITSESPSQAYLLTGNSGTGKTTSARIMALSLNCLNLTESKEPCLECKACSIILSGNCPDIIEKNAADHRGIDAVREISKSIPLSPMYVRNKVYILDEFHQMTKEAQTSLLKTLEEAPKKVFIILCTTHPSKVLPTIKTRCQKFNFKLLPTIEISKLLEEVTAVEAKVVPNSILEYLSNLSGGSPRQALVLLQQAFQLEKLSLSAVKALFGDPEEDPNVIKFCNSLSYPTASWSLVMDNYKKISSLGAAGIGMICAGFFRNKLMKASSKEEAARWTACLKEFLVPFAEGKLGENQLIYASSVVKQMLS